MTDATTNLPVFNPFSYVPLSVTLSTELAANFSTAQIWIAIFGQLISTPPPGVIPPAGPTFYLDAGNLNENNQPLPVSTESLPSPGADSPNQVILPSFTLQAWGKNLSLPVPAFGQQYTGRMVISVGTPVQAQVASSGSVSAPSASNPDDPSTGTFYDFLEFTVTSNNDNTNNVDIDTSQVDSFGFPMQLQFFQDTIGNSPFAAGGGPVGVQADRGTIFTGSSSLAFQQFIKTAVNNGNAAAKPFGECSAAAPLRLISPKDVTEAFSNPLSADPLNTYFDAILDQFFLKYFSGTVNEQTGGGQTFSLMSQASGTATTYSGGVVLSGSNFVLRLQATTGTDKTNYDIYYPFFTTNSPISGEPNPAFPTAAAPSWIPRTNESASQMVFACDGVFADNTGRPNFSTTQSAILGDLENSISAALNRGIVLNDSTTWGDASKWFPQSGIYNYWVQYWHQNGLAVNNQAYAFPYDDKFGTSTNLQQNSVGLVTIILGSWGSLPSSQTSFTTFPASANQDGPISLSATVTGTSTTPTGTVSFYIDGVLISAAVHLDGGGNATLRATLPALPDGAHDHTYPVTAVYSGDNNYQPSVALHLLPLIGPAGRQLASARTPVTNRPRSR